MDIRYWIKKIEQLVKRIRGLETEEDRLGTLANIKTCTDSIHGSLTGWESWLTNARIMDGFNEKELDTILKAFKSLAIGMLEVDLEWSKKKLKDIDTPDYID